MELYKCHHRYNTTNSKFNEFYTRCEGSKAVILILPAANFVVLNLCFLRNNTRIQKWKIIGISRELALFSNNFIDISFTYYTAYPFNVSN